MPLHNKSTLETRKRSNIFNFIMGIYNKTTANIICNAERLTIFPYDQKKTRFYVLCISIQHCVGGSRKRKEGGKEERRKERRKKELKLFLFADDIVLHIEIIRKPLKDTTIKTKTIRTNKLIQ